MIDLKCMNSSDEQNEIEQQTYNVNPFYALRGRLGRARFLTYLLLFNLCVLIFFFIVMILLVLLLPNVANYVQSEESEKISIFSFFSILLTGNFFLIRRRFHDLDHSGWIVFIFLIPYINILLSLYLFYSPGDKGLNYFGYPAKPAKEWHKIIAWILGSILMSLHIAWIVFYLRYL